MRGRGKAGDIVECIGETYSGNNPWKGRNKAIRDHERNSKQLFVWKALRGRSNGTVECLGQYRYFDHTFFRSAGRGKKVRDAIKFVLRPIGMAEAIQSAAQIAQDLERAVAKSEYKLERVGPEVLITTIRGGRPPQKEATITVFERDPNVIALVHHRAQGRCEGCGEPAPFFNRKGQPYLEVHHVQPLADEGKDEPGNAVALCPTCHRRAHHSRDHDEFTSFLQKRLLAILDE